MQLMRELEVVEDAEDGLNDLHGLVSDASREGVAARLGQPVAEARDFGGPLVFGGEVGEWDGVVAAFEDAVDGGYVARKREGRTEAVVEVTPLGHELLRQARRH